MGACRHGKRMIPPNEHLQVWWSRLWPLTEMHPSSPSLHMMLHCQRGVPLTRQLSHLLSQTEIRWVSFISITMGTLCPTRGSRSQLNTHSINASIRLWLHATALYEMQSIRYVAIVPPDFIVISVRNLRINACWQALNIQTAALAHLLFYSCKCIHISI